LLKEKENMLPTKESQIIASDFTKYVRTGDKSLIEKYKLQEVELALFQYSADKDFPHYKAMESRVNELKQIQNKTDNEEGKIDQQELLDEFKKITIWWPQIKKEFGVSKHEFGRKINFVQGEYKRAVIFRDVEHAYALSKIGFAKPAVILAGSVMEELLRLYLQHKNIEVKDNTFSEYVRACEKNGFLKDAVHSLTTSVRHFRNLIHLEKESKKKDTISHATAAGAVTAIFTLVNDF